MIVVDCDGPSTTRLSKMWLHVVGSRYHKEIQALLTVRWHSIETGLVLSRNLVPSAQVDVILSSFGLAFDI